MSPTVGLYFYADDYIRFVSNLAHYLRCELEFIDHSQSKYAELLEMKRQTNVPIGVLDDVEIVFLHYHCPEEAKEKWNRRIERINYDNLIVKFSEQNLCEPKHLKKFDSLPFDKKLLFVKKNYKQLENQIKIPFYEKCASLLSDIHEYRFVMKEVMHILNR